MSAQGNFEDRKTVPQRLKPSLVALFTARLKPCPSVIEFSRRLFSPGSFWPEAARLKLCPDTKPRACSAFQSSLSQDALR